MKKVAVFLAEGFEEGEALFVVDVLRRAEFQCNLVSINEEMVKEIGRASCRERVS